MVEPILAGVAESDLGKTPDRNWLENAAIASVRAVADAGCSLAAVDGVAVAGGDGYLSALLLAERLGIGTPSFLEGTEMGGSSFQGFCEHVGNAMARGRVDVVVVAYGSTRRTDPRRDARTELFQPLGTYATSARQHMRRYGTTKEQLASVAVATREWASMNPKAAHREPITVEDVCAARSVIEPFTLLDCCLVSDGGGAVVLVSPRKARELGVPRVEMAGVASTDTRRRPTHGNDVTTTAAAVTGPRAFQQAGITPGEVDVAQIYDPFTYTALVTLEDLGFCRKGEGGRFVEGATTAPGGELPMNTQGGGLSYCHPGRFGVFLLIEAVRQLRGEYTGDRQVEGAETAVVHSTRSLTSSSTVVLRREV